MNKEIIFKGMAFLAGGAIGSVVTWKLVKTKYEQLANEEIESVREYYASKNDITLEDVADAAVREGFDVDINVGKSDRDERTAQEIRDRVQELGYINEQVMKEKEIEKEEDEEKVDKPYIIPPEETWEQDYPTISLTYYEGDGVLADEQNKIIDNVGELVPEDFASHFGEYEDDSVYVRNDGFGAYYEILKDYGSYTESN